MDNKSNLYNSDLMDHIKNARNYRKISGQHIFAEGLNPLCGDRFEIFLVKQNEHIHDVSYQCECCGISMASASIMTEILKNKSILDANKIVNEFINTIESQKFEVEIDKELVDAVNMVKKFTSRVTCATLGWSTIKKIL